MNEIEQTPELRRSGLGGSDMASILGVDDYRSPLETWLLKVGLTDAVNLDCNDAVWYGKAAEPLVSEYFTRRTGMQLTMVPTVRHFNFAYLMGHPDRQIVGKKQGLEIKTRDWRSAGLWGDQHTDQIPENYLVQCHYYNLLMDWEVCHVACLSGRELQLYEVPRSAGWDEALLDAGVEFWEQYVIPKVMPPIIEWNELSQRALKKAYPSVAQKQVIVADEKVAALVALSDDLKAKAKDIEATLKGVDAQLRDFQKDNEFVLLPDGKCLRKIQVQAAEVPAYYRETYTYLRKVKQPKGVVAK